MNSKLLVIAVAVCFLLPVFVTAANDDVEVVVVFEDEPEGMFGLFSTNANDVAQAKAKVADKHDFSSINGVAGKLSRAEIAQLRKQKGVKSVIESFPVSVDLQDSVDIVGATAVRNDLNLTGSGQSVCVIDTGLDVNNHNFSDNFVSGYRYLGSDRADCSENETACLDDNSHGTHVSGIVRGVSPQAGIVVVKALDSDGRGSSVDLLKGIDYCTSNAEQYNISVISMSLGASCFDQFGNPTGLCYQNYCDAYHSDFKGAFAAANEKNISVVVSTGNDYETDKVNFPSCVSNAIRVGSSTKWDSMSSYGNRWNQSMILAPGQSINSTDLNGEYSIKSGTSMSAPHVSAGLLLLQEHWNTSNITFLRENLFDSNFTITDSASNVTYTRLEVGSSILNGEYNATPSNESFNETGNVTPTDDVVIDPEPPASTGGGGGGSVNWDDINDDLDDRAGEDIPIEITASNESVPETSAPFFSFADVDVSGVEAFFEDLWSRIAGWLSL